MKNKKYQSFQQKIVLYILYSGIVTTVVELIFIYIFSKLVDHLRENRYRSAFLDRDGFNPQLQLLIFILLGIGVFITTFFLFLRHSMKYIKEISKGIQNISSGDLDTPIAERGNNEFTNIAHRLNDMTAELKILMERERLAEKTKNDLITNVAHDLRTPLTSIIGYLNLIRNPTDLSNDRKADYLEIVYNKSKRLENLANDLFGFAKLNYKQIDMKLGELDLVKLLSQLLDEFYPSFQREDLVCKFIHKRLSVIVEADGNLLARLFDNLISNAIKYGAEGKLIKVILEDTKDEKILVKVVNYGRIIPVNEWENIFQKFYRVDQSRSGDMGGTGLGLAIVKSIVEMHQGTIEVQSDLHGTVFQVVLFKKISDKVKQN